jgi:hypothetical protein
MKRFYLILVISCLFFSVSFGQQLVLIKDTINKFQIGVPVSWRYGIPQDKTASFMAIRQKIDENDKPREVIRINIFHHQETDLDKEYKNFIGSISQRKGFRIIEQEDKFIHGRNYKYLVETHVSEDSQEEMTDCILLANNNGEILMLVMVTISENINRYRILFDRVAESIIY